MTRNVFEKYEDENPDDIPEGPHVMLPPLAEGFRYELKKLHNGNTMVVVTGSEEVVRDILGDSPEARVERHRD